jgi:hypothetical protein
LIVLSLTSAVLFSGSSVHAELFRWLDEVLPAPTVPDPPMPAPFVGEGRNSFAPASPAKTVVTYRPRVVYRSHPLHRKRHLVCLPAEEVVLYVKDPIRCCVAEIPVCIPYCCGEPHVSGGSGVLGRGVVCYTWDCGVRVKVVFRPKGAPLVHYFGV